MVKNILQRKEVNQIYFQTDFKYCFRGIFKNWYPQSRARFWKACYKKLTIINDRNCYGWPVQIRSMRSVNWSWTRYVEPCPVLDTRLLCSNPMLRVYEPWPNPLIRWNVAPSWCLKNEGTPGPNYTDVINVAWVRQRASVAPWNKR